MNPLKGLVQLLLTPLPAVLKTPLYRLFGARIAAGARVDALAVVIADRIELGPQARIKALTLIVGLRELQVGAYATISNLCVIHGRSRFVLGPRGMIAPGCLIDVREPVTIGEYSGLGPRCTLMTHGSFWPCAWGYRSKAGPIELEPLVWITFNCTIGPRVRIASGTFVMPGSGIYADVPAACVLVDAPLDRRRFPLATMQQPVTHTLLRAHWRTFLRDYHAARLAAQGWVLTEGDDGCRMQRGAARITIDFFAPQTSSEHGERWLFGYDVADAFWRQPGLGCLDFRYLLQSSHASRRLHEWLVQWYQSTCGGRFADVRHRDCFRVTPPLAD